MDFTRPGQVDAALLIETAQRFDATNLFGSPALLDRVGRFAAGKGLVLGSLRRVISAGAPVGARILERFMPLLPPGAQVFTPYGATESMPVTSIGSDEILRETRRLTGEGRGVCVGRPVAPIEVRIIRIDDGSIDDWADDLLVPPGTVGEITVEGPVVTAAYFNRPEATRLAKIRGPRGQTIHRLGDLGYLDGQGRLWFCGRKSQRVRAHGGDLCTIPCEGIFNAHPAVRRTALVGVSGPGGERPVLCVELEASARNADRYRLREELLALGARHELTRELRTLFFHPRFPVDIRHNAKIGREELARWAARELGVAEE
jgi:acyl-CoA synthetase (AMP-forming)/AMP-acid ligase II